MDGPVTMQTLDASPDTGWSVCVQDSRLVFCHESSTLDVPIEGPLRWAQDGRELSFEEAMAILPHQLHGWMALAALIALRHCLAGLLTAAALPPGYHEWQRIAFRVGPLPQWMAVLGRLDGIDVPTVPDGVDDGFGETVHSAPDGLVATLRAQR